MTELDNSAFIFLDKRARWDDNYGNTWRWWYLSFELDYLLRPEMFVLNKEEEIRI